MRKKKMRKMMRMVRMGSNLPARLAAIMSSTLPRSTPAAVRSSSTILVVEVVLEVVV